MYARGPLVSHRADCDFSGRGDFAVCGFYMGAGRAVRGVYPAVRGLEIRRRAGRRLPWHSINEIARSFAFGLACGHKVRFTASRFSLGQFWRHGKTHCLPTGARVFVVVVSSCRGTVTVGRCRMGRFVMIPPPPAAPVETGSTCDASCARDTRPSQTVHGKWYDAAGAV